MKEIIWSQVTVADLEAEGHINPEIPGIADGEIREFSYHGRKVLVDLLEREILSVFNPESKSVEYTNPQLLAEAQALGFKDIEEAAEKMPEDWTEWTPAQIAGAGTLVGYTNNHVGQPCPVYLLFKSAVVVTHSKSEILLVIDLSSGKVEYTSPSLIHCEVMVRKLGADA